MKFAKNLFNKYNSVRNFFKKIKLKTDLLC